MLPPISRCPRMLRARALSVAQTVTTCNALNSNTRSRSSSSSSSFSSSSTSLTILSYSVTASIHWQTGPPVCSPQLERAGTWSELSRHPHVCSRQPNASTGQAHRCAQKTPEPPPECNRLARNPAKAACHQCTTLMVGRSSGPRRPSSWTRAVRGRQCSQASIRERHTAQTERD